MQNTNEKEKVNRGWHRGHVVGITEEELKKKFYLVNGRFTWRSGRRKGDVAGTLHSEGYTQIQIGGVCYLAHKLVWLWHHGQMPEGYLTHRDGDRTNNRIKNLVIK